MLMLHPKTKECIASPRIHAKEQKVTGMWVKNRQQVSKQLGLSLEAQRLHPVTEAAPSQTHSSLSFITLGYPPISWGLPDFVGVLQKTNGLSSEQDLLSWSPSPFMVSMSSTITLLHVRKCPSSISFPELKVQSN